MKNSNRKPFKFEARRLLAMMAMAATMTAVAQEKSQDPILSNYEFENCGYVDSEGKTVIPFIYEDGRPFCNGKAWVQKDGKWGMINAKGETVMDFQFDSTSKLSESIIFVRRDSNDVSQYMIYSHDGVRVNTKTFSSVRAETCGYIPVACNGKEGLLDLEGREALPCVYDFVDNFAERKLRVRKDGRFSFLDENLNPLFNATFDYADYFINGMARIRKGPLYGYIDASGTEVIPCEYTYLSSFSNGTANAQKDERKFKIDTKGNEVVLPPKATQKTKGNSARTAKSRTSKARR